MKRVAILLTVIGLSTVGLAPATLVNALPPLPTGAGDITPEVNWSQFMTPLMNSSAITCTVTSIANYTGPGVSIGTVIAPMTNPFSDGLKLRDVIADSDANVGATCTSEVTAPSSPITVTGTFSAPAMPANVGTSGNISMKCVAKTTTPTIVVSVSANFGGGVTGKARIVGQGSQGTVNFNCEMGLSFSTGAGIAGTVTGSLSVGDPTSNPSCASQSTPTCIPVSLINANVVVLGGSGALAEAEGSGTYSFNDSFKLSAIDSALAMVGASSLRKMALRPALAANTDELKVNLTPGKHKIQSATTTGVALSIKSGTQVRLTSSPTSKCKVTATFKKTVVTLASPTISTMGTATYSISGSAVKKLKTAGAKKNTKILLTTTCKLGSKSTTSKSSPKFAG